MNLADLFSGGENSEASDAITSQLAKLNDIKTPTAAQLTLPQLQQYVIAGIMTPEEAQSYLQGQSGFATSTADNTGMDSELQTLGELQNIVNDGGADPEEQADIQKILNTLGTSESGDNAAIVADNARRGVANSGLTMAARLAADQNSATNANSNALNAEASEAERSLAALTAKGTLGGNIQGQQYTQTANAANAADAIAKFNASQKQQTEDLNVGNKNAANAANLANAQDVSNKNTVTSQTQQESIPAAQQQAFQDSLSKAAAGMTGADALANQKTQAGQQNAGILGGLLSTAGTVGASYLAGNPYASLASALAQNNSGTPNANVTTNSNSGTPTASTGGRITSQGVDRPLNMTSGGPIPGHAAVPGDSPTNDTKLIAASPDEIMIPRTAAIPAMQGDMSKAIDFLRSLPRQAKPSIHPKAVLDTMRALSAHHAGAV